MTRVSQPELLRLVLGPLRDQWDHHLSPWRLETSKENIATRWTNNQELLLCGRLTAILGSAGPSGSLNGPPSPPPFAPPDLAFPAELEAAAGFAEAAFAAGGFFMGGFLAGGAAAAAFTKENGKIEIFEADFNQTTTVQKSHAYPIHMHVLQKTNVLGNVLAKQRENACILSKTNGNIWHQSSIVYFQSSPSLQSLAFAGSAAADSLEGSWPKSKIKHTKQEWSRERTRHAYAWTCSSYATISKTDSLFPFSPKSF